MGSGSSGAFGSVAGLIAAQQQQQGQAGLQGQAQGISSGAAIGILQQHQMQQNQIGQLQQGQMMIPGGLTQAQQNNFAQAQHAYMQQMNQAANQMSQAQNIWMGSQWGQTVMFNPWHSSKYSKEEIAMSIGQQCTFGKKSGKIIKIKGVTVTVEGSPGISQYFKTSSLNPPGETKDVYPNTIDSIPFIEKLKTTKLYKLAAP